MRVAMLYEDIATVEKSMQQVVALSEDPAANANQLVRWVNNKEEHCDKIQRIVTQYFMTQRIKPVPASDTEARERYAAQLAALHGMLIQAMKAKQTTDPVHVEKLRGLVEKFSALYFSKEELEHLREHHE
jgi:nickel superoxide dismutase